MSRRKTSDPRRVAILDRVRAAYERHAREYARLRRLWNRTEKARLSLARAEKQLAKYDAAARADAAARSAEGGAK